MLVAGGGNTSESLLVHGCGLGVEGLQQGGLEGLKGIIIISWVTR